jgi:peptide/nickel transport system permease protein
LTFFVAVTINWMIPRFMPGDPVQSMIARAGLRAGAAEAMTGYYMEAFGLDVPLWQQYTSFWAAVLRGDLGVSIWLFPQPVTGILLRGIPYTLALVLPAVLLSWWAGNRFGAFAARNRLLDNTVLPVGYILRATPEMWLGILLVWLFGIQLGIFPISGAYAFSLRPSLSWVFIRSLLLHWFLPFASLFIVYFGGWAIGMRNLIIYEYEADYARYLHALGAPRRLIRRYAFRNAVLPQITGLALQLGVVVGGALVTEIVFAYPGLGHLIFEAIRNQDYFLLQGAVLFIVIGVLIANFLIDIAYVIVDPRTRVGVMGGGG